MSRLKERIKVHLIHKLGGVTEQEMMLRCRPFPVSVRQGNIQTLKVKSVIDKEKIKRYPGYLDMIKDQMAHEISKKMIECGALVYRSDYPDSETWAMETTATARVIACEDGEWI